VITWLPPRTTPPPHFFLWISRLIWGIVAPHRLRTFFFHPPDNQRIDKLRHQSSTPPPGFCPPTSPTKKRRSKMGFPHNDPPVIFLFFYPPFCFSISLVQVWNPFCIQGFFSFFCCFFLWHPIQCFFRDLFSTFSAFFFSPLRSEFLVLYLRMWVDPPPDHRNALCKGNNAPPLIFGAFLCL